MFDEETLKWHIASLRREINADWLALAKRSLDPEKRKALRDHLEMNTCALRSATEQLEAGLRGANEVPGRIAKVDLKELELEITRPRIE